MISNLLLKEKWKTQERLAREANYDIKTYLDNIDSIVKKMVNEKGVKLKYSNRKPSVDTNSQQLHIKSNPVAVLE